MENKFRKTLSMIKYKDFIEMIKIKNKIFLTFIKKDNDLKDVFQ